MIRQSEAPPNEFQCRLQYNSPSLRQLELRAGQTGEAPIKRGPTVPPRVPEGPLGPDEAPEGPWGRRGVPRGSVHRSCTDTGQSSDPSSPDGSRRAKTGFRRNPIWPEVT